MTLFEVSYVLLWLVATILVLMSVVLLYLLAQLQERTSLISAIRGEHLIGKRLVATSAKEVPSRAQQSIRVFGDTPHVILALSPGCGMCRRLIDEIASMPKSSNDLSRVRVLLLCIGAFDKCAAAVEHVQSAPVLVLDEEDDSTVSLRHVAKPVTLMVDESGIVVDVRHPLNIEDVMATVRASALNISDAPGDLVATA